MNRLFNVDTDEACSELGRQFSLMCSRLARELVERGVEEQVCLRDLEILAMQHINVEISRAILIRRQWLEMPK